MPAEVDTDVESDSAVEEDTATEESTKDATGDKPPRWRRLVRGIRLPRSWRGRAILAVILVLLLGGGAGGYFWYSATALPDGVAFRVGDRNVTVDELDREVDTLRALYGIQAPTDPAKLDGFRRDVAKSYAVSIILDNAAADAKIVIADKMAQDTLSRFIEQQYGSGSDAHDKFVQALGTVGTNEQAVLTEIKRQLAINQLFTQTAGTPQISDADLRAQFDQRQAQLATPERRDLRNIVVSSQAEADQVATGARAGTPFPTLAQQRSLDGSTKDNGGELGVVTASQLDAGYAKAAFAAPVGTVFGPVQTQYGWNVGMVVQSMPPTPAVFDQVKDNLRQQLQLERQLGTWRHWLSDTIVKADVTYADAYRPADPDAAPQGDPSSAGVPSQQAPAPAGGR
jgi:peptidyl-prolyl cis-trans isomerase C